MRWQLNGALEAHGISEVVKSLQLSYSNETLDIELDIDQDSAKALNQDEGVRALIRKALHEVARYDGSFDVTWDIPF